MKKLLLTIIFSFYVFVSCAQEKQPLWTKYENTNGSLGNGNLPAAQIDRFQNIIVCAGTYSPSSLNGFLCVKYDRNGNLIWKRTFDTFANDIITTCKVDSMGAVYVGGNSVDPFTNYSSFVVIKYASNGDSLWKFTFPGASTYATTLSEIIHDSEDGLDLICDYFDFSDNKSGLLFIKINNDGSIIQQSYYSEANYSYKALSARINDNKIFFWGIRLTGTDSQFICWQINTNGQLLDIGITMPYNDYFWKAYYVDPSGSLLIGDNAGEYKITKFTPQGGMAWVYKKPITYILPGSVSARVWCITTDSEGAVYISGGFGLNDTVGVVNLTTKLNPNGVVYWEHIFYIPDIKLLGPYTSKWASNDYLFVSGPFVNDLDSNYYEIFVTQYTKNGFQAGFTSDLQGEMNWPTTLLFDDSDLYIAGNAAASNPLMESPKLFLSKYNGLLTHTNQGVNNQIVDHYIYPNPFKDHFWIVLDYREPYPAILDINIYDQEGKMVDCYKSEFFHGINIIPIRLIKTLKNGTYFISINLNNQNRIAKAIKIE